MTNTHKFSFIFHDYETFGQDPAFDRPAQFASIKTDSKFNFIEDPQIFYCAPADDYLPQPDAVMINGITPQYAILNGVNEAEFAKRIYKIFNISNSCILGYNNINFDNEVTRYIFYRNFYDPYSYIWKQGNSHWDLINVLRAYYALRPDGINWPKNDYGFISFKLEDLTYANNIQHNNLHSATSDVFATIEIAKLIQQAQPKMFDYFFRLRDKNEIRKLIDIIRISPLIYVSSIFSAVRFNTSLIAPLAWHPKNKNIIIVCDLAVDLNSLITLDSDTIRLYLYTPKKRLTNEFSFPIKLIHINKCPILAPINILRMEDAQRIGIDLDFCLNNLTILRQHTEVKNKIIQVFTKMNPLPVSAITDVDGMLYSGFFSNKDRSVMEIIHNTLPKKLLSLNVKFEDSRLNQLFFRYRARNYPNTLTKKEQLIWLNYLYNIFSSKKITQYLETIKQLINKHQKNKQKCQQLKLLIDYVRILLDKLYHL